jgi:hypothetical protein
MDLEKLYDDLYNKPPDEFSKILSSFLDETSDEEIQYYNTFDDSHQFSQIWVIIREYNLGNLAVKFIKKLMLIQKEDPQKNKFMMGFANNSENTIFNLAFLKKYDHPLSKNILDIYTNPDKKLLFKEKATHAGILGGNINKSKKLKKKTKKRTTRIKRRIKIGKKYKSLRL